MGVSQSVVGFWQKEVVGGPVVVSYNIGSGPTTRRRRGGDAERCKSERAGAYSLLGGEGALAVGGRPDLAGVPEGKGTETDKEVWSDYVMNE